MKIYNFDVVIVGSGVAGLTAALELDENLKAAVITKKSIYDSNSYLAQGGICVKRNEDDEEDFINDTLKAGHFRNDVNAVRIMVEESRSAIETLERNGVVFDKSGDDYSYTREGGHGKRRILHVRDITGKAIMEALGEEVERRQNITVLENTTMADLIMEKEKRDVRGILCTDDVGNPLRILSQYVIIATGGLGGLFKNSTNFRHIKGDALAISIKHGIELKDISYIQIHPTALYENKDERRFLISESVRGEGAELISINGNTFVDKLKPRDIVSQAIFREMEKDSSEFELLDIKPIGNKFFTRFPNIASYLKKIGLDMKKGLIPIVPAQHYTMGGIKVDLNSKTSMDHLYVVGEASCTGVHGKNRLASNSLLESVVFSKRCSNSINKAISMKSASIQNIMDDDRTFENSAVNINIEPLKISIGSSGELKDENFRKERKALRKTEKAEKYLENKGVSLIWEKIKEDELCKAE